MLTAHLLHPYRPMINSPNAFYIITLLVIAISIPLVYVGVDEYDNTCQNNDIIKVTTWLLVQGIESLFFSSFVFALTCYQVGIVRFTLMFHMIFIIFWWIFGMFILGKNEKCIYDHQTSSLAVVSMLNLLTPWVSLYYFYIFN